MLLLFTSGRGSIQIVYKSKSKNSSPVVKMFRIESESTPSVICHIKLLLHMH